MNVKLKSSITFVSLLFLITACYTISPFDEKAYTMSTSNKAMALTLMNKAEEPYSIHSGAVEEVLLEARKAYEYAKQRPKNEE